MIIMMIIGVISVKKHWGSQSLPLPFQKWRNVLFFSSNTVSRLIKVQFTGGNWNHKSLGSIDSLSPLSDSPDDDYDDNGILCSTECLRSQSYTLSGGSRLGPGCRGPHFHPAPTFMVTYEMLKPNHKWVRHSIINCKICTVFFTTLTSGGCRPQIPYRGFSPGL